MGSHGTACTVNPGVVKGACTGQQVRATRPPVAASKARGWDQEHGGWVGPTAWRVGGISSMAGGWDQQHGGRLGPTAWRVNGISSMAGGWYQQHGGWVCPNNKKIVVSGRELNVSGFPRGLTKDQRARPDPSHTTKIVTLFKSFFNNPPTLPQVQSPHTCVGGRVLVPTSRFRVSSRSWVAVRDQHY